MNKPAFSSIIGDGLWTNNPGIVQLLGLCPLLAVTTNVVNGLGLGLATTLTLLASNATVSTIRRVVRPEVRIPVFVLIIASVVTIIELAMNAWLHELYKVLGIFIPLIVTNCAIIGRAESFASRNTVDRAVVDALAMGTGFTLVLVTLGGMRELVGQGTLLAQAHMMFGEAGRQLTLTLIDDYRGFLLAVLPPGAFIGLGFIIAGMNLVNNRRARRIAVHTVPAEQPSAA
jgi:electron transport complex protein RnfE